jgi:hypothetical protein
MNDERYVVVIPNQGRPFFAVATGEMQTLRGREIHIRYRRETGTFWLPSTQVEELSAAAGQAAIDSFGPLETDKDRP